jgi:hypothetical protein
MYSDTTLARIARWPDHLGFDFRQQNYNFLFSKHPNQLWCPPSLKLHGSHGVKEAWTWGSTYLHIRLRLTISGTIPPLLCIISVCIQITLPFTFATKNQIILQSFIVPDVSDTKLPNGVVSVCALKQALKYLAVQIQSLQEYSRRSLGTELAFTFWIKSIKHKEE